MFSFFESAEHAERRRTAREEDCIRASSHVTFAHLIVLYLLGTKCHCKWKLNAQHSLQALYNPQRAKQNYRIMEEDLFRAVGKTCLACLVFSGLIDFHKCLTKPTHI